MCMGCRGRPGPLGGRRGLRGAHRLVRPGEPTASRARHREALAVASEERQALAMQQTRQIMTLLQQDTERTRLTQELAKRNEALTAEVHGRVVRGWA